MYSVEFIYEPGEYDSDFHALDAMIDEVAKAIPAFLGVESWVSPDGKRKNAIYYWSDLESLKAFSIHPKHLEAKRQYQRWYNAYHIVISEVIRSYGDGRMAHITPNERSRG